MTKDKTIATASGSAAKGCYHAVKRAFDVIFSLLLLLLMLPLMIVIGILIRATSPGKCLYIHERVGKNHTKLRLYKFRTMLKNADQMTDCFSKEQKAEWEANFKVENDPRVTKVGRFLRKTSLDELPQLLNILKGEMSFVGPRPITEEELKRYGSQQEKLLSIMPGLTGYWQAYVRNECTYEQRMQMELYYVDHASFAFDLRILGRTVIRVLSQKGAQ